MEEYDSDKLVRAGHGSSLQIVSSLLEGVLLKHGCIKVWQFLKVTQHMVTTHCLLSIKRRLS